MPGLGGVGHGHKSRQAGSQAARAAPTSSAASAALREEGLCGMGMGVTLLQVNSNSASLSPSPSHSLIYRLCNGERGRAHKALMNVPSFLEVSSSIIGKASS